MSEHVTEHKKHAGLGQLAATAICGNDITSSCLYVCALSILFAGKWAPVSLLIVAALLYLFRSVYSEVVGALPLNGGAYNALLNTTNKFSASMAACLTILSYMATAVISAGEASHYAFSIWGHAEPLRHAPTMAAVLASHSHLGPAAATMSEAFHHAASVAQHAPSVFDNLPAAGATVGLLAFFMVLSIIGITESAVIAIGIFFLHLFTVGLLMIIGGFSLFTVGTDILVANFNTTPEHGLAYALFFGFCAAMLGVSGFESSSNFVEEQKEGVFPKTLRNMWIAVSIINPGMALLALALVPLGDVPNHQETLLAHMGDLAGGKWLSTLISIDAALVLSGAVLTSFVGVTGLIKRMTLDRCLPQFLLKTNRRGTAHRIVIAFFILSVSVYIITGGDTKAIAGVYAISFLAVMILFGLGNILLKIKRERLPRPTKAPWLFLILGIAGVTSALIGNIYSNLNNFFIFLYYFIPAVLIVGMMLTRIALLKALLFTLRGFITLLVKPLGSLSITIREKIEEINSQQIVYFTRGDNVANLNAAVLYVRDNEHTNRIKVVTVSNRPEDVPAKLKTDLAFLNETYPKIDIEFLIIEGKFGPELIQNLSEKWNIPPNLMFIGSPGNHLIYGLAELGGVRLII